MFRKSFPRDPKSIVKDYGHIELSAACIKANQTGFFALGERVKPDSYDGNDTNIQRDKLFFGGRRIDAAIAATNAIELAAKSASKDAGAGDHPGTDSGAGS